MSWLVYITVLFPLLGFLILGIGFRKLPDRITSWIGPGTILASFVISGWLFVSWLSHHLAISTSHPLFTWFSSGNLSVSFGFLLDPLSLLMMLIVTGVGFLIHVYSIGYMKEDPGYARFFAFMNLFVFFMLLLVMADNYLVLFIGWEGVGLCSYLLIGFWFRNREFGNAAKKAFIMNRIGDLGFLLGLFLLFTTFGSFRYAEVFTGASRIPAGDGTIIAITLLLFVGAVGKSAQIPLHTWLPDAMAGPTPVSALIHAATMVAAGVYMVARSGALYVLAPATLSVVAVTGLATALFAASVALFQNDIKKVLAYSTISQLGFMFLALGLGAFTGAMFHLTTHAFFKALLFLAAGSVIHALGGEQDIRRMGGLKKDLPKTALAFLAGTVAIAGLPPFSGFFSKDEILLTAFSSDFLWGLMAFAGSLITVLYMFRVYYLVFLTNFRGENHREKHIHESSPVMILPLIALAFLSAAGGVLNIPALFGGQEWLTRFLEPVFPSTETIPGDHGTLSAFTSWLLVAITVTGVVVMIYLAYRVFVRDRKGIYPDSSRRPWLPSLLSAGYYTDEIYRRLVTEPVQRFSGWLYRIAELGGIDRAVNGTGRLIKWTGSILRYIQTGHVGFYLFVMILGIILILACNIFIRG
jgi:NADH-quinone oxidoreductase subunit L